MREEVWSERDGTSQTTHVRILLSSWGLALDLTARLDAADVMHGWPVGLVKVGRHLGLDVAPVRVAPADVDALVAGLKQLQAEFPVAAGPQVCVVRVENLSKVDTDYQPEAATIAASAWAADLLGVERPRFEVTFDKAKNRYCVTF